MTRHLVCGLATAILLASALSQSVEVGAPDESCANLNAIQLPDTTVKSVQEVSGPAFTPPDATVLTGLPSFCRVARRKRAVIVGVGLPLSGGNGKFEGVGNGANAGSISYAAMAAALKRGYATASTDTGHATRNARDGRWAIGHPELVADFGYRA